MCETEGDVPHRATLFTTLNERMLDFFAHGQFFSPQKQAKKVYES